jgi:hypothetical protein
MPNLLAWREHHPGDSGGMLDKNLLHPIEYQPLVRLGPPRDGGYVVPGDQLAHCRLLLSLGVNDDWSFDRACVAANPGLAVVGVDHSVGPAFFRRRILRSRLKIAGYSLLLRRDKLRTYRAYLDNALDYFRFFSAPHRHLQLMVAGADGSGRISVASLLAGHAPPPAAEPDVFLKMDIEGGEYEAIGDIVGAAARIRCIAAEFHDLDTRTDTFNQALRELRREFLPVHVHANNHCPYDAGNDFPSTIELTLVNRRLLPAQPALSRHAYPRAGLDFPCDANKPDFKLVF